MKRYIVFYIIILITFNAFSSLPDYYSGTVKFGLRSGFSLFDDEITFTFFEDFIVDAMHYLFLGGFFPNDTTVQAFNKYHPNGNYECHGYYGNNDIQFKRYTGNGDSQWDKAVKVPDSMVTCGIYKNPSDNVEKKVIICFESHGTELPDPWPSYSEFMYLNPITYIQKGNRFFKMQIIDYTTSSGTYGPNNSTFTTVGSVTVQFATDSAGNGIFIKDTSHILNQNIGQNNNEAFPKFSKIKNCIYFHDIKPNTKIYIYNLQGALMKSEILSIKNRDIKLNFSQGMYILSVVNSKKRYSTKILIR